MSIFARLVFYSYMFFRKITYVIPKNTLRESVKHVRVFTEIRQAYLSILLSANCKSTS